MTDVIDRSVRDATRRADVAERAAEAGGAVAVEWFREALEVDTKESPTDYVTRADRASQAEIADLIAETYPEDVFVAEEGDAAKSIPDSGAAWIVDPVDGTYDFVHGLPLWAVSVAAVVDGEPVAAANALPAMNEVYAADLAGARLDDDPVSVSDRTDPARFGVGVVDWWDFEDDPAVREETGLMGALVDRFGEVRRLGSSQTTWTYVASGALDAAVSINPSAWNNVAGAHLIEQAGGAVTDLDGDRWRHGAGPLVASNGACHDAVLDAARSHRP